VVRSAGGVIVASYNKLSVFSKHFLSLYSDNQVKMHKTGALKSRLILITLFAVAMALLEAVVVIYLREIYYPEGFSFPLHPIDKHLIVTELFRELATLIMLLCIGLIASKKALERFAWFIFTFAVWDIFYYIFLKLFIGWPDSLFTWDILFLIPSTWVGPVIGPVINSITMILLAVLILYFKNKGYKASLNKMEWLLLILGSVVVILAYTEEYFRYMIGEFSFQDVFSFSTNDEALQYASKFIPQRFNWLIYTGGQFLFFSAIYSYFRRMFNRRRN